MVAQQAFAEYLWKKLSACNPATLRSISRRQDTESLKIKKKKNRKIYQLSLSLRKKPFFSPHLLFANLIPVTYSLEFLCEQVINSFHI